MAAVARCGRLRRPDVDSSRSTAKGRTTTRRCRLPQAVAHLRGPLARDSGSCGAVNSPGQVPLRLQRRQVALALDLLQGLFGAGGVDLRQVSVSRAAMSVQVGLPLFPVVSGGQSWRNSPTRRISRNRWRKTIPSCFCRPLLVTYLLKSPPNSSTSPAAHTG